MRPVIPNAGEDASYEFRIRKGSLQGNRPAGISHSLDGRGRINTIGGRLVNESQPNPVYVLAVGVYYFQAQAFEVKRLAHRGHVTKLIDDQPGHGGEVVRFELLVIEKLDFSDLRAAVDQIGSIFRLDYRYGGGALIFVFDLAEDLLDNILKGHKSRDSAVFINDNRNLNLCLLHVFEQFANGLALGHKVSWAHAPCYAHRHFLGIA